MGVINNAGFGSDVLFDQFLCADSHSCILLLKAQFITWCIFHSLDNGFTVGVGLTFMPPFIGLYFTLKRYENIHQSRYNYTQIYVKIF